MTDSLHTILPYTTGGHMYSKASKLIKTKTSAINSEVSFKWIAAFCDYLNSITIRLFSEHQSIPACLDLSPLLPLLFRIAFHLQLVLLSYHPIFLRPYHFLKLVSFLGANRTKSASVCL